MRVVRNIFSNTFFVSRGVCVVMRWVPDGRALIEIVYDCTITFDKSRVLSFTSLFQHFEFALQYRFLGVLEQMCQWEKKNLAKGKSLNRSRNK